MSAPIDARRDDPAIELDGASVRVGGRTIWSEVSMRVRPGELVALLGANGSDKSTLLKVVLGALPLAAGRVRVLGRAPGEANRAIGYLPQRRAFDAGMRLRGSDIVRLGLDGDRWGLQLPLGRVRPGDAVLRRGPGAHDRQAQREGPAESVRARDRVARVV